MFAESEYARIHNRRTFLTRSTTGLGLAALATLLGGEAGAAVPTPAGGSLKLLHHTPRAKRVIYLFQWGHRPTWISSIRNRICERSREPNCRKAFGMGSGSPG